MKLRCAANAQDICVTDAAGRGVLKALHRKLDHKS
uniref:Uncharacterized protein n=1 Tax=Anguilla anguilla TaxID=7936 RepID=A0A0E9V0G6_ANGAN